MPRTWLIFDCNYIAYRAYHTTSYIKQGVVYGFLRDVKAAIERFNAKHYVFAWDAGRSLRELVYPAYKAQRSPRPEGMSEQITELKMITLKDIGFRNVLWKAGYEADDIIASLVHNRTPGDQIMVVTADADMYQLLHNQVRLFNPRSKKITTLQSFGKEYGITPDLWPRVKAIAGCKSDNITGVKKGLGEKTAISILAGHQESRDVRRAWKSVVLPNLALTKLPYPGTPVYPLQDDAYDPTKLKAAMAELGAEQRREREPLTRAS